MGETGDVVMTKMETAAFLKLSLRVLERLEEEGRGPARVNLSARRIAYRRADVLAWLETRTKPAKHLAA
jgi:predicted DNA-binding transcriptional regulator AlpA